MDRSAFARSALAGDTNARSTGTPAMFHLETIIPLNFSQRPQQVLTLLHRRRKLSRFRVYTATRGTDI